ncbi:hypothetical protein QT397_16200 [Microbulbifer sp. MKSA007]|nr:hypothetical protein QT397_16200 [Microbulbifer sp. MKSA007]
MLIAGANGDVGFAFSPTSISYRPGGLIRTLLGRTIADTAEDYKPVTFHYLLMFAGSLKANHSAPCAIKNSET